MTSWPPAIVVDASLATMWLIPEQHSLRALSIASSWSSSGSRPIAPAFMLAEVTNAVYKRVRRGELALPDAITALNLLERAGIELREEPEIHRRALTFANRLNRPSTYDAHYLALAEIHACEMWTGDERLYNAVREQVPWLHWIGTYEPSLG